MGRIKEVKNILSLVPTQPDLQKHKFKDLLNYYLSQKEKDLLITTRLNEGRDYIIDGHHSPCLIYLFQKTRGGKIYTWDAEHKEDFIPENLTGFANRSFKDHNLYINGRFEDVIKPYLLKDCPPSIKEMMKNYPWLKSQEMMLSFFS